MNKFYLIFTFLVASNFCSAQYDVSDTSDTDTGKEPKYDRMAIKERIYVGADLSVGFGNALYIYVAPIVGYDLYKGLSAGFSPMYQLYRVNFQNGGSASSHAYGGGIFARWRPEKLQMLLLQTEFDVYNAEDFTTSYTADRVNLPAFMVGAGYAGNLGRGYYQFMLMYDFVNDINNPLPKLVFNMPLYIRYGLVFYLG